MADRAPLDMAITLGALRPVAGPAGDAARETLVALGNGERVTIKISRTRANGRRMALYWAVAATAAANLGDKIDGGMNAELLHRVTKIKLGIGRTIKLPSGAEYFDEASISFAKMSEPDRAAYVTRALGLWSSWLGVDVTTLQREAQECAA